MQIKEVIFIGLPGMTHHYGGLSPDNVASRDNIGSESSPKDAALQALALARTLCSFGISAGILPPHLRPHLKHLQEQGFTPQTAPLALLEQASSSSFMWTANAATVSPSSDTADKKLRLTAANLHSNPHRRLEAQTTYQNLKQIFTSIPEAVILPPLPAPEFLDEGAANHMRFSCGLNVFVYGKRQNLAASQEVAKNHCLPPEKTLFIEQNHEAIAAGVFHNDVIAVSHENLLLVHEHAFKGGAADIEKISAYGIKPIIIKEDELSVAEAVGSYFFNSQIVTGNNNEMIVIAPQEMQTLYNGKAAKLMEKYFAKVVYLDLKQSMRNGGGPACLRLRVPMTDEQITALKKNNNSITAEETLTKIENLVKEYYPQKLVPEDLRNPELLENGKKFLSELSALLK